MYITPSPEVPESIANRAREAARGSSQREWTWWMLGPGLDAEFQGKWAASTRRRFGGWCARLAALGIKTEPLPLGYEAAPLWFITGELHPAESLLWQRFPDATSIRDTCVHPLAADGLMDVDHVAELLAAMDSGSPWRTALYDVIVASRPS